MKNALTRRCITIGGVFIAGVLLVGLSPLWIILGALADLIRGKFRLPIVRLLAFGTCYCWLEIAGVTMAGALWIVGQSGRESWHFAIQRWWSTRVLAAVRVTCSLRVEIEGLDSLGNNPLVALCRHASIADALTAGWVLSVGAKRNPRFVLKKELSFDPCLDVVGRRIPNYFVDRSAVNTQVELAGIAEMARGMTNSDVAIIFPEGTRTSSKKLQRALQKIRTKDPERAQRLGNLQYLLPPKPAGSAVLIDAVPNADVVTVWHVGFDGLDNFRGMLRRLAIKEAACRVVLTRHARQTVPSGVAFAAWLDEQWIEMDRKLSDVIAIRKMG